MNTTHPAAFREALALEIDDGDVRLARIVRRRSGLELATWNTVSLPSGAVVNGLLVKPEVVQVAILQSIETAHGKRFNARYVALTIPEPRVFMTVIPIQGTNEPTAESVQAEALQHIPFPLEDIQLDWRVVDRTAQAVHVLVGAIPNDVIASYTKLIRDCRLVPLVFEPESAALARAVLAPGETERSTLLLDLGQTVTTVLLSRQGVISFSSSSPGFSGLALTRLIADRLNLTPAQAEKAKRLFGLLAKQGKGEVRKALLPAVADLVRRLQEIERFAATHLPIPAKPVTALVLAGGGAVLPGLVELLAAELRVAATAPLPADVHRIALKSAPLTDDQQRSMTTVLGSALRIAA